ncbi:MAG: 6,7-dimethyl-8-ribityllumazine synthase [Phycisphaerales bacterium]
MRDRTDRGGAAAPSLSPKARGRRVAIVTSRYHDAITSKLEEGAIEAFREAGGEEGDLVRCSSPGAFELVAIASALAARSDLDGVVALGCIVAGETRHDRYLAAAVAQSLADLSARHMKPVAFGVLTVNELKQARDRAGGKVGNKGREAMDAVILAAETIAEVARPATTGARP